uniref:Scavenger receptor class B member 1 n=1 Tax=Ditylenchus dipsaci TaxID=166011 RepID=A0A915EKH2_9BILA
MGVCKCQGCCCWCCGSQRTSLFQPNGWTICLVGLGLLSLVAAIALWAFLPSLYIKLLYSQLVLSGPDETGQLPKRTYLWSHAPVDTFMHFHIVRELGPFVVRVIDTKKEVDFKNSGEKVHYKNYRTFVFDEEKSCAECRYDTVLTIPNLVTTAALAQLNNNFIEVPFGELMFDGYVDALLSAAHLPIVSLLSNMLNNGSSVIPFPLPDAPTMALFNGYNNSNDMDYLIDTGLQNIELIGQIYDWAGFGNMLPEQWWGTPAARMINGSDSGSFQAPGSIDQSSTLPLLEFRVPIDHYDTNLAENVGFRYSNPEAVNYFPDWPNCPASSTSSSPNCNVLGLDCSLSANFCNKCCNGSFVGGTYVLPPGFSLLSAIQLTVRIDTYRIKQKHYSTLPTIAFPPHFAYSPAEVYESVDGLKPDLELHTPMSYHYEPVTGSPLSINVRFQTSLPIYRNHRSVLPGQLPNKLLPLFYVDTKTSLKPFAYDQLYLGVVIVPQVLFVAKIVTSLLVAVFIVGGVACQCLWPHPRSIGSAVYDERFTTVNSARF